MNDMAAFEHGGDAARTYAHPSLCARWSTAWVVRITKDEDDNSDFTLSVNVF